MEDAADIVARIRARPNDAPLPTEYLLDDAADEIERLRRELEAQRKAWWHACDLRQRGRGACSNA